MDTSGGYPETKLKDAQFILFIFQVLTLFSVSLISLINLSLNLEEQKLWVGLLSMSLGCILPAPRLNVKQTSI